MGLKFTFPIPNQSFLYNEQDCIDKSLMKPVQHQVYRNLGLAEPLLMEYRSKLEITKRGYSVRLISIRLVFAVQTRFLTQYNLRHLNSASL